VINCYWQIRDWISDPFTSIWWTLVNANSGCPATGGGCAGRFIGQVRSLAVSFSPLSFFVILHEGCGSVGLGRTFHHGMLSQLHEECSEKYFLMILRSCRNVKN